MTNDEILMSKEIRNPKVRHAFSLTRAPVEAIKPRLTSFTRWAFQPDMNAASTPLSAWKGRRTVRQAFSLTRAQAWRSNDA